LDNQRKNPKVSMLYKSIRNRPPTTETPRRASFTPYETAAPLLVVDDPELLEVLDPLPDLTSAVVTQENLPWMSLLLCKAVNGEQSMSSEDLMVAPPLTSESFGALGVKKDPSQSIAPPTCVSAGMDKLANLELLRI